MQVVFNFIWGVLKNSFDLLMDMGPYLLLGFFVAGILNEFISAKQIARHLGKSNFGSVLKAALFGVPLPLCSCGVIPPTMTLRKAGASRGSVLSFLIATPTSGVDSIAATYSLLGPVFATYRVAASFFAAIFTGTLANLLKLKEEKPEELEQSDTRVSHVSLGQRIVRVFHYGFVELISEIGKWLVLGILIGGLITYVLPENFFGETLAPGIVTILLMIVISVPIYVCATGSIPIAAALMLKGLNPGAAFVFLLAGPATNSVTITVISRFLGRKSTLVYLITLILSAVGLGVLLDVLWVRMGLGVSFQEHMHHQLLPLWLEWSSAILLLLLLIVPWAVNRLRRNKQVEPSVESDMQSILTVPGMTCNNCVNHVKNAAEHVPGVEQVVIDLKSKKVNIQHKEIASLSAIAAAIENAGYDVTET